MLQKPDRKTTINLQAKPGDTFFWHVHTAVLPSAELIEEEHAGVVSRFEALEDSRAIAVVGQTCVEQLVDALLDAFIDDYAEIRKGEFSFWQRIRLARSMRLIPMHIFNACELLQQIRDEFLHNVQLKSFLHLPSDYRERMKQYVRFYNDHPKNRDTDEVAYRNVVSFTCLGLIIYRYHVRALMEYVHSNDFQIHFGEYVRLH